MNKQLYRTVLVIGDNPEEIIQKYSANSKVSRYLYLSKKDVPQHRKNRIQILEETIKKGLLNEVQIDITKEYVEYLKELSDEEYFEEATHNCEIDTEGNAYTYKNPNAFYTNERCPQETFEKTGEESGFCNPFKLYDDYISYQAEKGDIDWSLNHLNNTHVYSIAWDMVKDGKEPRTDAEHTVYKHMKNRIDYFDNFIDKDDYISYNTSFWTYGVATEDYYEEIGMNGVNDKKWVKDYFKKYIESLPDNTLLTLYEVQSID